MPIDPDSELGQALQRDLARLAEHSRPIFESLGEAARRIREAWNIAEMEAQTRELDIRLRKHLELRGTIPQREESP